MTFPRPVLATSAPARATWRGGGLTVAVAAVTLLVGCGSPHPDGLPGAARAPVRGAAGSYGGVRLGMPMGSLASYLGPPLPTNNTEFLRPAVQPPYLPADNPYDVIYPDVRFTTVAGRVASISVYGRGARSDTGVGVGDPLALVLAARPGARCVARRTGLDPEEPGCEVRVARGVYEYFSGDPVVLIALSGRPIVP